MRERAHSVESRRPDIEMHAARVSVSAPTAYLQGPNA